MFVFIVELEKELELEQKAITKKDDGEARLKQSTLKSNAMFTKSKKKKGASKRKVTNQTKNKELGRPISLNIIYEEPSQVQSSSNNEVTVNDEKCDTESQITSHINEYTIQTKEKKPTIPVTQEKESAEEGIQSINHHDTRYIEDNSPKDTVYKTAFRAHYNFCQIIQITNW